MFTRKKKVGSKSGEAKPEKRLLRLFRSDDIFQDSPIYSEYAAQEDAQSKDQKMIRNVMLEAQYQRGKALLAFENNRQFY